MTQNHENLFSGDPSRILNSPQAKALLAQLSRMDPKLLRQAAALASGGDTEGAQKLLTPILQDEKIQKLTQEMRDANGGL